MSTRHIIIVMDRSGSMRSKKAATEQGLMAFLEEQDPTVPTVVTLHQFDDKYETVYTKVRLPDVPPYYLKPRGSTALADAICRSIQGTDPDTAPDRGLDKPVMVILTDGHENASDTFSTQDAHKMITERREQGWTFIFLGADQDAIVASAQYGIDADTSLSYSSAKTTGSMRKAGQMVSRGLTSRSYGFTKDERDDSTN